MIKMWGKIVVNAAPTLKMRNEKIVLALHNPTVIFGTCVSDDGPIISEAAGGRRELLICEMQISIKKRYIIPDSYGSPEDILESGIDQNDLQELPPGC